MPGAFVRRRGGTEALDEFKQWIDMARESNRTPLGRLAAAAVRHGMSEKLKKATRSVAEHVARARAALDMFEVDQQSGVPAAPERSRQPQ